MIFVALSESAERGELFFIDGGMCRFHRRRDGVVVIRELLVLPAGRGAGVGRRLVEMVRAKHPGATLRALCPKEYASNGFWRHMGFASAGATERANVWERRPSSTVQTATPSSPDSP